jgi:hypothetical protein
MKIEIRNKVDGRTGVGEFMELRRELARLLSDYLIANDLVEIEFKRGNLIVSIEVKSRKSKVKNSNL